MIILFNISKADIFVEKFREDTIKVLEKTYNGYAISLQ